MSQVFGPGGRRGPIDPLENLLKRSRRRRLPWGWLVLGLIILFAIAALNVGPGIYTDLLWFGSLGLESVYLTTLRAQLALFGIGTAAAFGVLLVNVLLARYLTGRQELAYIPPQERLGPGRIVTVGLVAVALFLAVLFGAALAAGWRTVLLFQNAQSFGLSDPVFNQPVSFYVYSLPLYRHLLGWAIGLVVVAGIAVGVLYGFYASLRGATATFLTFGIRLHSGILGAVLLLLIAINFRLSVWELVYSTRGVVAGAASYTDVNAQQGAYLVLTGLAILAAGLVLIGALNRSLPLLALAVGGLVVGIILIGVVYPSAVEEFQVKPSQLLREEPYIANNIRMTRLAFGLDAIEERDFPAEESPTPSDIQGNPGTIDNLRIWDPDVLKDVYNQIQSIRLYYDFHDVDVDRYTVDGRYREVMLAARELVPERLSAQAQNWVNQHLTYTHGYGAAMSPVNEAAPGGLPEFWLRNVPPEGKFKIDRPEIYYGEETNSYVFVNTAAQEFDYPRGDENVYTTYKGGGGVKMDSFLTRLAYAWQLGDGTILLASQLTPESRLLYRRNIVDRVRRLAPFLLYDPDPYLVVADGQFYWILDAYTYTDRFPNATPSASRFNYLRNSVKATVNAYDGSVAFYVNDPDDPLLRSYASIYPGLFQPLDRMPAELRDHLRYPEYLFRVQAEMYRTYHMRDPRVFFSREDLWAVAKARARDRSETVEPYYVIMRLPGESGAEFLLILPFTPSNRDNMIAWLAARSDGEKRGQLIAYKLPKEKLTFGPFQIEARIDQDSLISQQFTLWNQSGSKVIRGNLLVIPVEKSLLYVEPIFLRAESGQIPELTRIVVAAGNKLTMQETLAKSLAAVFGEGQPAPSPGVGPPAAPAGPLASDLAATIRSANDHYRAAQEALRAGDFARFGDELRALEADLRRLNDLAR